MIKKQKVYIFIKKLIDIIVLLTGLFYIKNTYDSSSSPKTIILPSVIMTLLLIISQYIFFKLQNQQE